MKAAFTVACVALTLASAPVAADNQSGGLRYSITVSKFENRSGIPEGQSGRVAAGPAKGPV